MRIMNTMFTVKKEPRESVVFVMDTATGEKLSRFDLMSIIVDSSLVRHLRDDMGHCYHVRQI